MNSTCDLCGYVGPGVRPGLVVWVELGQPYNAIDRCIDHNACRERVMLKGEPWPIVDQIPLAPKGGRLR